jgi:hypothetical protein
LRSDKFVLSTEKRSSVLAGNTRRIFEPASESILAKLGFLFSKIGFVLWVSSVIFRVPPVRLFGSRPFLVFFFLNRFNPSKLPVLKFPDPGAHLRFLVLVSISVSSFRVSVLRLASIYQCKSAAP